MIFPVSSHYDKCFAGILLDSSGLSLRDNGNRKTLSIKKRIYIEGNKLNMSTNLPANPADVWTKYMNFPLSGAVNVSQQFMRDLGFINIYNINTGDDPKGSEIEKEIIADVAGYGRQLGWVIEVLKIIADRYELKDLNGKEYTSMEKFFDLSKKIEKIKQKNKQIEGVKQKPEYNMLTPGQLNLMIEGIRAWEKIDKNKFDEMVSRIKSAFP